jgi:K+-transporting ATPase ATPase A chain
MTSLANNNGSSLAGLNANTSFYNLIGVILMSVGRYGVIIPVLAIAGSLARKKNIPVGPGTLPTHGSFFIGLLVVVVLIIAGLTFIPALALGPIVEALQMNGVSA